MKNKQLKILMLLIPMLFSCSNNETSNFINITVNKVNSFDSNNEISDFETLGILSVQKGFVLDDIYEDLALFFDYPGPTGGGNPRKTYVFIKDSDKNFILYNKRPFEKDVTVYVVV